MSPAPCQGQAPRGVPTASTPIPARSHLQAELVLELPHLHPVVQGGDVMPLFLRGRGLRGTGGGGSGGASGVMARAQVCPPPPCSPRGPGLTFASCVSSFSTCAMSSCTRRLSSGRLTSLRSMAATDTMN